MSLRYKTNERMGCQGRLKSVNGRLVYKTPHTCSDVVKCELNKATSDLQDKVFRFTTIPIKTLYEQQRKQFQLLGLFNISFPDYGSLKDTLEKCRYGYSNENDVVEVLSDEDLPEEDREMNSDIPSPSSHVDEDISVRWNNYATNLKSAIPDLLQDEKFVDVTLACGGNYIKCHKVILGACSSYFEELLSVNPCKHPIILMRDFEFWELEAVVQFMYRGDVNISQEKLPRFLQAAEILKVKGLTGLENETDCDENSSPTVENLEIQPVKKLRFNKNKKRKCKRLSTEGDSSVTRRESIGSELPTEPPEKLLKIPSTAESVALKTKPDVMGKENRQTNEDSVNQLADHTSGRENYPIHTEQPCTSTTSTSSTNNFANSDKPTGFKSLRDTLVLKQKKLLELNQQKLELELASVRAKLIDQKEKLKQTQSYKYYTVQDPNETKKEQLRKDSDH